LQFPQVEIKKFKEKRGVCGDGERMLSSGLTKENCKAKNALDALPWLIWCALVFVVCGVFLSFPTEGEASPSINFCSPPDQIASLREE
jgi:gamma-glutamylcysteine synthetase